MFVSVVIPADGNELIRLIWEGVEEKMGSIFADTSWKCPRLTHFVVYLQRQQTTKLFFLLMLLVSDKDNKTV